MLRGWWTKRPKDPTAPDRYDRKAVCVALVDGKTYEVASMQSLKAEALVDEIAQAMDTQVRTTQATLFTRPGHLILRLDHVTAVWTVREAIY